MMIDEVGIYAKLESALFGSMVHTVSVASPIVHADVCTAKIYNTPQGILSTFTLAERSGFSPAVMESLREWSNDESSVFGFTKQKHLIDHIFRPRQLISEPEYFKMRLFRPLEPVAEVIDALCLSFPMIGPTWCLITFLRCAPNKPFEDMHTELLELFKPALARVIRTGYQREIHGKTSSLSKLEEGAIPTTTMTANLLEKLSRTERLVLSYLRTEVTERQIADTINRSPHTVHVHVKNIYRKLGVKSRRMLISLFNPQR